MTAHSADTAFADFCKSGDPEALARVFDLTADRLLRTSLHLCRHPAQAEDLVQETFVAAMERASDFEQGRPVLPWLLGILKVRVKVLHANYQRRAVVDRLPQRRPREPGDELQQRELAAALDRAIDELPASLRPVMVLRVRHEMSAVDIAHVLGVPPGTVRSQISRGMQWVRRALPSGLATGLLATWTSARGLAAVRTAVVEHSIGTQVAGPVVLAGGIIMQKLLLTCAVLLALAGLMWSVTSAPELPAPRLPGGETEPVAATYYGSSTASQAAATLGQLERDALPSAAAVQPLEVAEAMPVCMLTVHVRWQDGEDAESAIVTAMPLPESPGWPEEVGGKTNASGEVRLAMRSPGAYRLRTMRGRALDVDIRRSVENRAELWIPRGFRIEGMVVDALGQAVAGADLWLTERWRHDKGAIVASTDGSGAFKIRSVTGRRYLRAQHASLVACDLAAATALDGQTVRVRLVLGSSGGQLTGRVLDTEGRPVAHAQLWVRGDAGSSSRALDGSWRPGRPPTTTVTDLGGRFGFGGLRPGHQHLVVRAPEFAPHERDLQLRAGVTDHLDIHLTAGAAVHGIATDELQQPIVHARVWSGTGEGFADRTALTDATGAFVLRGLPVGEVRVTAKAERALGVTLGPTSEVLELVAAQLSHWSPVLSAVADLAVLRGRVFDHEGAAMANMRVLARSLANGSEVAVVVSSVDGAFVMTDAPHGAVRVMVSHRDQRGKFPLIVLAKVTSRGPLELRAPRPGAVHGSVRARIVDADGEPCPASLELWHDELRIWRSLANDPSTGELLVNPIAEGTLTLRVRSAEAPWLDLGTREVTAGQTLDLGTVRLAAGGRVRGRITGPDGRLLADATVRVLDARGEEAGALRCRDGLYESGVLANGEYSMVAQSLGCSLTHERLIIAGDTERNVRLLAAPERRVQFELRGHERLPSWLRLVIRDGAGRIVWLDVLDPQKGELAARFCLHPGRYTLRARAGAGLRGQHVFTVGPDDGAAPMPVIVERGQ